MLKNIWQIICTIGRRFVRERFTYSAAALTYTTLLAIVPLMAVSLNILSALPVVKTFHVTVEKFIFTNFVPASGDVIQKYLESFVSQASKLSLVGTIVLVVTAILMLLTIESTMNNVWKIKNRRKGTASLLLYWAILTLAPIFIGISLAATSYIVSIPFFAGSNASLGLSGIFIRSVPFVLTVAAFTLLYVIVPNCRVPVRHGFIAALIAAIIFQLAKKGFIFYVSSFKTYELLYGTLAIIPLFLIWIYLSWVIILLGALISNVLATRYHLSRGGDVDPFMHAFLWLGVLWKAQQRGKGLTIPQLCLLVPGFYEIEPEEQIQVLLNKKLITITGNNQYFLTRDFSHMTLSDLYERLPFKLSSGKYDETGLGRLLSEAHHQINQNLDVKLANIYEEMKLIRFHKAANHSS